MTRIIDTVTLDPDRGMGEATVSSDAAVIGMGTALTITGGLVSMPVLYIETEQGVADELRRYVLVQAGSPFDATGLAHVATMQLPTDLRTWHVYEDVAARISL